MKNNGGYAFPHTYEVSEKFIGDTYRTVVHHSEGMNLRDYLAGQALIGIISSYDTMSDEKKAKLAYGLADAMLVEREKE